MSPKQQKTPHLTRVFGIDQKKKIYKKTNNNQLILIGY